MNTYFPDPSFLAYVVIGIYPLIGLLYDAFLPRHRAVVATLLTGFLVLPSVQLDLGGALYWNRTTAPFFVVMLGVLLRDTALIGSLRLRWFDLPMLVWCLVPFASSVTNHLGMYDGFSQAFYQTIQWGGPYFLGRLHFRTKEQLYDLARLLFLGGLLYLPLCVFEVRFSPMLHNVLYGFHQHDFVQTVRGSFYRPMVFLQHGLMVAMWMGMTTYLGWALTSVGAGVRFLGLPQKLWPVVMAGTVLMMQSVGAAVLMLVVLGLTVLVRATQGRFLLLGLALVPTVWSVARSTGALDSDTITAATSIAGADRGRSLGVRLDAEDRLSRHAWAKPLFGWSPSGFNRTGDAPGRRGQVVADGLWIIAFSAYGLIGLAAMLLFHLIPFLVVLREVPPRRWRGEPLALVIGAMGMIVAIIAVDNLLNAMVNPLFLLMIGALSGVLTVPGWDVSPEEDEAAPPARPEPETTRFRRLLGSPPAED